MKNQLLLTNKLFIVVFTVLIFSSSITWAQIGSVVLEVRQDPNSVITEPHKAELIFVGKRPRVTSPTGEVRTKVIPLQNGKKLLLIELDQPQGQRENTANPQISFLTVEAPVVNFAVGQNIEMTEAGAITDPASVFNELAAASSQNNIARQEMLSPRVEFEFVDETPEERQEEKPSIKESENFYIAYEGEGSKKAVSEKHHSPFGNITVLLETFQTHQGNPNMPHLLEILLFGNPPAVMSNREDVSVEIIDLGGGLKAMIIGVNTSTQEKADENGTVVLQEETTLLLANPALLDMDTKSKREIIMSQEYFASFTYKDAETGGEEKENTARANSSKHHEKQLKLSPNPAINYLSLEMDQNLSNQEINIVMNSISRKGTFAISPKHIKWEGKSLIMDLSHYSLDPGIYIVRMQVGDELLPAQRVVIK
ncbi:hypothetical protein [Xanthovirga aplysinae]|uniref:hypothetical protein n=1 Tax=Xanthovirga aplysinae TaxID=2529853 RepID=UPI0012BC9208|nr:hypothetical protein [Xanthovirga aplysinae]MTI31149.1 hypothetical protein [Xanthovirga aplysinae]